MSSSGAYVQIRSINPSTCVDCDSAVTAGVASVAAIAAKPRVADTA